MDDWRTELREIGRKAVAEIARCALAQGTAAQCQLHASKFYEALAAELERTGEDRGYERDVLMAAVAQCREVASPAAKPLFILARIKAAAALLESAPLSVRQPVVAARRPRLRVVQGGRI